MLIEHTRVSVIEPTAQQAFVHVNPLGKIMVDIPAQESHLEADFESLAFRHLGERIEMICADQDKNKCWQLALSQRDGLHIEHLIDEANQDYEQLMRDLF